MSNDFMATVILGDDIRTKVVEREIRLLTWVILHHTIERCFQFLDTKFHVLEFRV